MHLYILPLVLYFLALVTGIICLYAGFKIRNQKYKNILYSLALIVLGVMFAELFCATALRIKEGGWVYRQPHNYNYKLFKPDRQLVGSPRKNVTVKHRNVVYKHNSSGLRGKEVDAIKTKKRIVCIGGSTTYGIWSNNEETWVYYLDSLLQPEYEVLNLGIPGHSTAEHKRLLPDAIKNFSPDIVIFHVALEDLRSMNVRDLVYDYYNFHQPTLYGALGFCYRDRLPDMALLHAVFIFLRKIKVVPHCWFHSVNPKGKLSDKVDDRVVKNFSMNMDILLQHCQAENISVYLLPQQLNTEALTENNFSWWIPFLSREGIIEAFETLTKTLRLKANGKQNIFINYHEVTDWSSADFYDATHFNRQGNLKMAKSIAAEIRNTSQK